MIQRFPIVLSIFISAGLLAGCVGKSEDPVQDSSPVGKSSSTTQAKKPSSRPSAVSAAKPAEGKPAEASPAEASPAEASPVEASPAEGRLDEKTYDHFGAGVTAKGEDVTIENLVAKSDEFAGKKIRLTGKVEAVCKHKGCWMILADGEKKVRIKFRDYGFFVPKDCEGREAVLEGTYSVSKTSVAELKHLLEDEGKTEEAKNVTEPLLEMKVMADGVALKKK